MTSGVIGRKGGGGSNNGVQGAGLPWAVAKSSQQTGNSFPWLMSVSLDRMKRIFSREHAWPRAAPNEVFSSFAVRQRFLFMCHM
jgi:hypothetical protein